MSRDHVFAGTTARSSDFEFNEEVAQVFDDMLVRSVPLYAEQQALIAEVAAKFYQQGTTCYDLGCSTATTLTALSKVLGPGARLIGYDSSQPMIDKAKANVERAGLSSQIEVRLGDFNADLAHINLERAGVVTLCWTLQFVRPLKRAALIRAIYDQLVDGGVLIVTEKVLTNNSHMNRFFIDFYYDFKRRNGYSEQETLRKREALENVLVPYRVDENFEMFRQGGFEIVETFFQWYNFAGFLCVKSPAAR